MLFVVYDNSTHPTLGISVVLSNTGSVVDIADGTAITVTDTDKDRGSNPPTLIWQ